MADLFPASLDQMIDLHNPLATLAIGLLWDSIEANITPVK